MVVGTWNSDRFWTRSRNVRGAHVRRNGETIARPREESLVVVSGFRNQPDRFELAYTILLGISLDSDVNLELPGCKLECRG